MKAYWKAQGGCVLESGRTECLRRPSPGNTGRLHNKSSLHGTPKDTIAGRRAG